MKLPDDFVFTQSNLQDYIDCRYRFYLKYILHTKWPALVVDDALDYEQRARSGARFHRLVQQYLLGVPEERLAEIADADVDPLLATLWDNFLADVPPLLEGEKFVETTFNTALKGKRLLAKYDLALVTPSGKLEIFDWKTSQKKVRKDWLLERIQTRLYRLVLTLAGGSLMEGVEISPEQVEMNYWFAPHPETPVRLSYDQEQFETDQAYFSDLIDEIMQRPAEAFNKTSDIHKCRFCVYRSHCDRGTEAGELEAFNDFELEPVEETPELAYDEIEEIAF